MKTENGFEKICHISDLKEKTGKRFFVNDTDIAVFKVDGEIFAVGNICPHQKTPLMFEGIIENCNVICPVHGWEFNLKDGTKPSGSKGLDTYKVNLINDFVYVKVLSKKLNW